MKGLYSAPCARASWTFQTNVEPLEKFDVLEDDEVFCEGLVFHMPY